MMNDVTGKALAVGDKVVLIPQNGYTYQLSMGVVTGFTKQKVKIALAKLTDEERRALSL